MAEEIGKKRVTLRFDEDTVALLKHWAKRQGVDINDFVKDAIEFRIRWLSKDYPLPAMEVQRLNQLVDVVTTLSSNVHSLEGVVTSGFDSLLGLTRGDNYLLRDEDGDIG